MPKGVPNKRYTPEFKKLVIETGPVKIYAQKDLQARLSEVSRQ